MKSFFDYVDDFNKRSSVEKIEEEKQKPIESTKNSKVLCLNVEICSAKGAKLVIEKIQNWVSIHDPVIVNEETNIQPPKKVYKIPPKKIVKNPIVETRSHAIDILDGLPEEPVVTVNSELISEQHSQSNINTIKTQPLQNTIETVAGHASALL